MIETEDAEGRLLAKAQQVRSSGILGKSFQLNRLFDHLVEKSIRGECPKEIELAQEVFGIDPTSSNASDATVRASAHRLRKKLMDFGATQKGERLVLKKGEYRLVLEGGTDAAPSLGASDDMDALARLSHALRMPRVRVILLGLAALVLAALAFWFSKAHQPVQPEHNAIWTGVGNSRLPFLVVTGSAYAFGELNPKGAVERLVVDPKVASAGNLYTSQTDVEQGNGERVDLNYYVLPEAAGPALTLLTPILHTLDRSGTAMQTIGAARFNNDLLTKYNIVYIGLLDSLRELKAPFFEGAHFALSEAGDEITDLKEGRRFRSDWADPSQDRLIRRDYAYLSVRAGPNGNRLMIVAGLRDPGLVEAAQIASDPVKLEDLSRRVGSVPFEALYEVQTVGPSNYKSRLLIARALETAEKTGRARN